MNKAMELKDFVYLMLASLSENRQIYSLENQEHIMISFPIEYKQIIEEILCENNGWKERFSVLINMDEYFDDHFVWEQKLGITLKEVLAELGKRIEYDFEFDRFIIIFNQEEIEEIKSRYPTELREVMSHFTGLLTDLIYTRKFKEHFYDVHSYVNAIEKMHDIYEEQITEGLPEWYRKRVRRKK